MNSPPNPDTIRRVGLALAGHISRQNLQKIRRREELTRLASGPLQGIATKRSAKAGKKAARQIRQRHNILQAMCILRWRRMTTQNG